MKKTLFCTASAFALLLLSVFAIAQTPDTSSLRGTIVDQTNAAVPGVNVTATNTQTGLVRTAQSDAQGRFTITGLPISGAYVVTAEKSGFSQATLTGVSLVADARADLSIRLSAAGEKTQVTVTGVAGEVRTDEPQLGDRLSEAQVQETPLPNRRVTYLPLLNAANRPAINQGDVFMNQDLFTTNGAGRRQTWYEVDGTNSVDMWGRQTFMTNLPIESIAEMQVITNAFSAEYGFTTGGVVNIVTPSGSDKFHGDLFGLYRPAATSASYSGYTAANPANGNQITGDLLKQGGFMLSGPLFSKTHFFLNGEYSAENRTSPVISPVAPQGFVGHYRGWLGTARFDHEFNARNNGFLRISADSFHDTNPNGTVGGNTLPTVDRIFHRRSYTLEAGETATLSPSWLNDVRAEFQLASPITEFDPVILSTQFQVPIPGVGTFTTGTSQSALLLNHQFEFNDTVSTVTGRHSIRFGGQVIHAHTGGNSKEFGGPIYLGQFVYNNCTLGITVCESPAFLNNIANVKQYTQSYGNANYTVDDTLFALFVQDDIRVRTDLTVNLGLRYSRQTFTDATKDFAPRAGFAYDFGGRGKTVLRGGFGIYYSTIPDNQEANYALTGPTGVFNFTATPGQIGFPATVASAPLPAFPAGAQQPLRSLYLRPGMASYYDQFFPTSTLVGYPNALLDPYSEQWTLGVQHKLAQNWVMDVDYVGSHTLRVVRPLDVDAPTSLVRTGANPTQVRTAQAANCTRPFWIWWYKTNNMVCNTAKATNPQPPYALIQSDVNDGFGNYNALDVNLRHNSRLGEMLLSYTWSHALANVDPDIPGQNPNDPLQVGAAEYGNAIFDQRHRFVLSGFYRAPFKINLGGVTTMASGLPYNITTGANNSGDGATTDRPVINGVLVGRNAGRGQAIYSVDPFVERPFTFGTERVSLKLRAEAFNVTNHANFVGYTGLYGNGLTAANGFGTPAFGVTNQLPPRSLQFSAKLSW